MRYSGELGTPIVGSQYASPEARQQEIFELREQKLPLLFAHYRIDPKHEDAWERLALRLIVDHVPGFAASSGGGRRVGRPKKWDYARLHRLRVTVDAVKKQHPTYTDKAACKLIATAADYKQTWGQPAGHKGTKSGWVETLESRLQDARRIHRRVADKFSNNPLLLKILNFVP
jgi:hypothetical protein